MKEIKQICRVIILSIVTMFLFGCTTTNVFDESVPKEDTARLTIVGGVIVKSYNGISVDLKKGSNTDFIIPAGRTTLGLDLDYYLKMGNTTYHYTANDLTLNFNFEPGKEYAIWFWFSDDEGNIQRTTIGRGTTGIHVCYRDSLYKALYKLPLKFN